MSNKDKVKYDVKIGSFVYSLEEADNLARDRDEFGNSCGNSLLIQIDTSIDKSLQAATVIHEFLEQLNFITELGLEHNQITTIANSMYGFINDNPDLVKRYFDLEKCHLNNVF